MNDMEDKELRRRTVLPIKGKRDEGQARCWTKEVRRGERKDERTDR